MKQVYKIDSEGHYIEPVLLKKDEEIPLNHIETQPIDGLYRARWTGVEWIEDMTQEEIDALNNQSKEPTTDDFLLDFEFRVSMLELGL